MFGFKLIREEELRKLKYENTMHEIRKTINDETIKELLKMNEGCEKALREKKEMVKEKKELVEDLQEAMEQQTREKKDLQKQFSAYIAAQQLMGR